MRDKKQILDVELVNLAVKVLYGSLTDKLRKNTPDWERMQDLGDRKFANAMFLSLEKNTKRTLYVLKGQNQEPGPSNRPYACLMASIYSVNLGTLAFECNSADQNLVLVCTQTITLRTPFSRL